MPLHALITTEDRMPIAVVSSAAMTATLAHVGTPMHNHIPYHIIRARTVPSPLAGPGRLMLWRFRAKASGVCDSVASARLKSFR